MTKLYLVRHGESYGNKLGLVYGQLDIPLTDDGKQEIRKLAKNLEGKHIGRILSSPLERAYQTAEIIRQEIGLSVEIELIDELKERSHGTATGIKREFIPIFFPGLDYSRRDSDYHFKFPEGESIEDLEKRVLPWFETFLFTNQKDTLITSHKNIMKVMDRTLRGISLEEMLETYFERRRIYEYEAHR